MNWGGKGIIGCEILTGVKFIIPPEEESEEQIFEIHNEEEKFDEEVVSDDGEKMEEIIEYVEVDHQEEAKNELLKGKNSELSVNFRKFI